jgi:hypothetical protein
MESKFFSIGDIVALKTHPYFEKGTEIILSADHLMLSPLMVICEIHKATINFGGTKIQTFKYECTWFSTKTNEFIKKDIYELDLKLIKKCTSSLNKNLLQRGQKVAFKTMLLELGKRKSSLSFDDTSISAGSGSSVINSLLTFLPPVIQVVNYEPHKTEHNLTNKSKSEIRKVSSYDIQVNFFNPNDDRIGKFTLPIESLELIFEVEEKVLKLLNLAIKVSRHLIITDKDGTTIIKPRSLTNRCGQYFIRGYDLLSNSIQEMVIDGNALIKSTKKPVLNAAPKFEISKNPIAATPQYIEQEIINAISDAMTANAYIRIKYKNRNDKVTYRTIINYEIISVEETGVKINYLVGYCLLRHDNRSFRLDRIQNFEQLNLKCKPK